MKPLQLIGLGSSRRRSGPRPNLPKPISTERESRRWGWASRQSVRRWATLLVWTVAIGIVGAGGVVSYRELHPLLQAWLEIQEVAVYGSRQVSRKEVLDRLALGSGATLLSIRPDQLAIRLRTHPWVKDATVRRRIPHTLDVQLVERRPAAVLQTRSQPLLLDDEGHVLAIVPETPDQLLPVLLGIDPNAVVQGDMTARSTAQAGVRLAAVMKTDSPRGIRQIEGRLEVDAANPENLVAQVKGFRFQFGSTAFQEKWDRFRRVESDLHAVNSMAPGETTGSRSERREPNLRSREPEREIDLRYPGKVIVRERG